MSCNCRSKKLNHSSSESGIKITPSDSARDSAVSLSQKSASVSIHVFLGAAVSLVFLDGPASADNSNEALRLFDCDDPGVEEGHAGEDVAG